MFSIDRMFTKLFFIFLTYIWGGYLTHDLMSPVTGAAAHISYENIATRDQKVGNSTLVKWYQQKNRKC
jgi:hypothetical protein